MLHERSPVLNKESSQMLPFHDERDTPEIRPCGRLWS